MKPKTSERRKTFRYQVKKSPVIFFSTFIGKIVNISMGGIKVVHTGRVADIDEESRKMKVWDKNFSFELQGAVINSAKVNNLASQCNIKFYSMTEEQKVKLNNFIGKDGYVSFS